MPKAARKETRGRKRKEERGKVKPARFGFKRVPPRINPALKPLEGLAGEWEMEISKAEFLPKPTDTALGYATFDWLEDGGALVMRQSEKRGGAPAAAWMIGRDDAGEEYTILYFDSRGVSRRYEMSFKDGAWKMWREAPGFYQRFEAKVSEDGKTISGRWEKSDDGKNWEHDFDLRYRRIE